MTIIVDIDGTLADCNHRRKYLDESPKDWKSFYKYMIDDSPIDVIIDIVNKFYESEPVILLSGRPEQYRDITANWLRWAKVDYHELIMRTKGDYREDSIVKEEILHNIIIPGWGEPRLVIDDRQSVVDMWRRNGLICLQMKDEVN